MEVAPPQAGAVDADGCLGPERHHLGEVLGDQLLDVGQHQHPGVAKGADGRAHEFGDDQGLAGAGGHGHQGIAVVGLEVGIECRDGGLLVRAKRNHPSLHSPPAASPPRR